jgi:outer membrane protein TolC
MAIIPDRIPIPEHLSIGLLVHRPDLAAALYLADSAARLMKVAKTQFYPTIDLTAFVGFNALTLTRRRQAGQLSFQRPVLRLRRGTGPAPALV